MADKTDDTRTPHDIWRDESMAAAEKNAKQIDKTIAANAVTISDVEPTPSTN
jgi:hypothetical protein